MIEFVKLYFMVGGTLAGFAAMSPEARGTPVFDFVGAITLSIIIWPYVLWQTIRSYGE